MGQKAQTLLLLAILWMTGCSGLPKPGNVNTGSVTVSVSPAQTSATVKQMVAFTATVTGTTNTAVSWEVAGVPGGNSTVGTIDANGNYTAPGAVPSPSSVVVTAVSQASSGSTGTASVQINPSNSNQAQQPLPIKLGTSGGNADDKSGNSCCSGTLGSLLVRNGSYYILSNNHVLARSDQANPGEPITQPGLVDANCSTAGTNTVANLTSFVNLQGNANVDSAIALIVPGAVDTGGNILELGATATGSNPDAGPPHAGNGIAATIGENVAKSGRTTGLTCSTVAATDLTVTVSYQTLCGGGTSFNVTYSNQVAVSGGSFSSYGDSGSLIVDQGTADPVALLYGGSDTDSVGNPVGDVLTALADQQGNQPSFVGSSSTHQVIGCTLAAGAVGAAQVQTQAQGAVAVDPSSLAQAQRARDLHAPELLANPYISAVGVAGSVDRPGEAAVLIVVNPGQEPTPLPTTLEGVGTRIMQMSGAAPHGMMDYETAQRIAPVTNVFAVNALAKPELQRGQLVLATQVKGLMKQPGVQGVGITSSADAPGEAALMIYLVRGEEHNAIPPVLDGVRTRVRATSRFTEGQRGLRHAEGCRVPSDRAASTAAGSNQPAK